MEPKYNLKSRLNSGVRLLIGDDHPAIRKGVRQILQSHFNLSKVGEAASSEQVLHQLQTAEWDILILDINLPDIDGLEVLGRIKDMGFAVRTLVFSIYSEEQIALRCIKAGAYGFLSKGAEDVQIIHAVNELLNGRRHLTPALSSLLADQFFHGSTGSPDELSDREFQVMLGLGKGKSVSEIATDLCLSISSISTYRQRVLRKMGFANNAAIINYCIRNHLLS